jgi:ABC-type Fe3+/spermidine/putrescine transport system ATPase subunit
MSAAVDFRGVSLGYGGHAVLGGVDMTVPAGEVVALLGPSGSGKTTLLDAVAGFIAPSAGEIWLAGRPVSTPRRCVPPERRRVGMVFQNYALWPHLRVVDIVAYPIRRRGVAAVPARLRAMELLARVDITRLAERRPVELSGGEQQRVGLARALAADPEVFLFDEPTAHLDAHLRGVVLAEVARQRAGTGAAALYATHDSAEALAIADRIAVLHSGRLAQVGTPAEVYARPADLIVARLTGPVSVLAAPVRAAGPGSVTIEVGGVPATVPSESPAPPPDAPILVRPDWVTLGGDLPARVVAVRFGGPHTDYQLDTPAGEILVRDSGPPRYPVGAATTWTLRQAWVGVQQQVQRGGVSGHPRLGGAPSRPADWCRGTGFRRRAR